MNEVEAQRLLIERREREQERQRDPVRIRYEVQRRFDELMHRLRAERMIERWDVRHDLERDQYEIVIEPGTLRYHYSEHELAMDGIRGVIDFLSTIERDVISRVFGPEEACRRRLIEAERRHRYELHRAERHRQQLEAMQTLAIYGSAIMNPAHFAVDWAAELGFDKKAEKKAKELFISVAGMDCFKALEHGGTWKIIGSSTGHVYELMKRSSFCVRRKKDGAEMCAVVPGVPLWDHLLGIKLTIEHDEPTFLKTANVAGGTATRGGIVEMWRDLAGRFMPGGVTQIPADEMIPQRPIDIRPGAINWVEPPRFIIEGNPPLGRSRHFERMAIDVLDGSLRFIPEGGEE